MSETCEHQIESSLTQGIILLSLSGVYMEWRKRIQPLVLVNCLGGLPRNSVVRVTDRARNDLNCAEGP